MKLTFDYPFLRVCFLGCLLWTPPACAWNGAGHRLVAHLAWTNISPAVRQVCTHLLQQHPDYESWAKATISSQAGGGGDPALLVFAEASTWADDIRRDPRFSHQDGEPTRLPGFPDMEKHSRWHYTEANDSVHDDHIYSALATLYTLLQDTHHPASTRAYALVWLLHLVGDAHQPLHNGFRDDRGGNEVSVMVFDGNSNRNTNLHAFWDDLPGKSSLRGTALMHLADTLMVSEHVSLAETRPDFARWRADNFRVSRQFSYPPGNLSDQTILTTTFIRRSQTVTNRQLVVAGKRLALVLETALGKELRTPFHVERR
ncbi:MAG: hypothetical protein RIR18_189 [Pseudomonadota bacterium]|jgi:hypothetical protein